MTPLLLVAAVSLMASDPGPSKLGPYADGQQPAAQAAALRIEAVKFEPVRQGRNVVRVTVSNRASRSEIFGIGISTRSPDFGRGMGWGTQFTDLVGAGETRELRFVYWVHGPVTDKTAIAVSFYNPPAANKLERQFLLERRQFSGADVPRAGPAPNPAESGVRATDSQRAAVVAVLQQTQSDLKAKRYPAAWRSFSRDLCAVDFCRTEDDFIRNFASDDSFMKPYSWPMDRFLAFDPGDARLAEDGRVLLLGGSEDPPLRVYFAREDGGWKIDEIAGYVPQAALWVSWEQRVLPRMQTRRTAHFDLFYEKDSTAEKEVERIGKEREAGYRAIADLFGAVTDARIRLVFFENPATKYWETGHQGAGWAYDRTIVEVFNPTERLDPFHEACHILSNDLGDPPALFSEGAAVYVSERLGAPALKGLGGGTSRVNDRVREIRARNEWIPLDTLIRFTEIGSDESKPSIAYAEAASFVKFLVEQFGREKFLAAYKTLKNSEDAKVQDENLAALSRIYGMSLAELEAAWLKGL